MADIMADIDANIAAGKKLERIAEGADERLTADEARRLVQHRRWLSSERESLLNSLPDDD